MIKLALVVLEMLVGYGVAAWCMWSVFSDNPSPKPLYFAACFIVSEVTYLRVNRMIDAEIKKLDTANEGACDE